VDAGSLALANGAVALGAALQATVGFGMNLVALPLLMLLSERYVPAPLLVAHLVLVCCLTSLQWRQVERPVLGAALLGAVPGTALGMVAVMLMSRAAFVVFTASVLILGIAALALQVRLRRTPFTLALAGALSGLCGTTTSINGPPLGVVMAAESGLPAIRATLAVFLLCSTAFSLVALRFAGRLDEATLLLAAGLIPGTLAGILFSRLFLRRVADAASPRRVLLAASAVATVLFVGKEFLISPAAAAERCLAIDGDTLVCNRQKVRLNNVHAPELDERGGAAAKRRLQSLVSAGEVTLEPFGRDRYGRLLADVYVDGRRIEQADVGPRRSRIAKGGNAWNAAKPANRKGRDCLPSRTPSAC
jgi:uncharacterized membrane protein YfcA